VYRLEKLEGRGHAGPSPAVTVPTGTVTPPAAPKEVARPPTVELEQLQEAWQRTILPAVEERSLPTASVLREARPSDLDDERLTLEFPASAEFHRQLAEDPKNATLLQEALYEVTGRRLAVAFELGEHGEVEEQEDTPLDEDELLSLMKETFDARELEEGGQA
jgi:hypothetical protein